MYPDFDNRIQVFIALVLICFLVYANALRGEFIYDDIPIIMQNPQITHPGTFLLDPPALLVSWNYLAAKDKPFTYHLTNVLLHALNTILVFLLLRLFFKSPACFAGAALFAVHPIHVEAVTWITARNYLLIATFSLATFLLYYRSTGTRSVKGREVRAVNWAGYGSSVLVFAYFVAHNFSFYAVMPFLLAAADLIFGRARRNWKLWLPFIAIIIVRLVLARGMIAERVANASFEMGKDLSAWQNPAPSFIYSILSHLGLLLWPGRLTLYHQPIVFSTAILIIGVVFFAALAIVTWRWFSQAREVFFGIVLFILFLAPTYSPITVASLVGERYAYFPSVALCIGAAFAFERCRFKTAQGRRIFTMVLVFVTCAYAVRTVIRNEDWKTGSRLWRSTLAASPLSPWAHSNMGYAYQQEGNMERAIREYKRAINLKPNLFDAYNNLGTVYHQIGRLNEALEVYQTLLTINPRYTKGYNNLGVIYNEMGKLDAAVEAYRKAIELNPSYAFGYFNLSVLYQRAGKLDEASAAYQRAITLDPSLRSLPARP